MFHIKDQFIGDGNPCFITFEIGPTHDGVASAKRLIKASRDAGANAVKFQIFDADRLVADKQQMFSYGVLTNRETGAIETIEEPLFDILKRRCLEPAQWREIKQYCDELNMAFFATVGFDEDVDFLEELGCHSIKIGSADVNHFPLLRRAARTGMCVQLDTGMASLGEIEAAVDVVTAEGNKNIIIHLCPSGYPAHAESIHLNIIKTLKQMFPYPVAYSDHTPGGDMDVAAVALGANLVEKTITEDRTTRGVEHSMSIEPPEMTKFVEQIRYLEVAMGDNRRSLSSQEIEKRTAVRRSVFMRSHGLKGQKVSDCDIEFRRPGYGIPPSDFDRIEDAVLTCDVSAGEMLNWSDIGMSE